jgi:hypothetical protein
MARYLNRFFSNGEERQAEQLQAADRNGLVEKITDTSDVWDILW